jgi:YHS domain-containing protein
MKEKIMGKFITFILLISILYFSIRSLFRPLKSPGPKVSPSEPDHKQDLRQDASEMIQDPECGTYVDPKDAVKAVIDNQARYFCSNDCMEKFKNKSSL